MYDNHPSSCSQPLPLPIKKGFIGKSRKIKFMFILEKLTQSLIWLNIILCPWRGHVWMWELDCEEGWAPKNWCFWTVVLEKTLESPLDCKEIKPVHPKGQQSWVFIGRTDAEAETPILWPRHVNSWLIVKDPDAGRDWGAGGEGDDRGWDGWMASPTWWMWVWVNSGSWWWTGGLACCDSWGRKESDTTERLNWTELKLFTFSRKDKLSHKKTQCKLSYKREI